MANDKDADDAASGGDKRYSSSSSAQSYLESDDEEENPFSYYDAAAAAMKKSPGGTSISIPDDSRPTQNSTGDMPGKRDLLGVPVLATFGRSNNEPDDVEETIVFHEQAPTPTPKHRANQEYYDVLEMASSRLRQDSSVHEWDMSSGDEAVRKKKKKKKKSKKEKRKKQYNKSEDDEEDVDRTRRSAVFQSLFPPSMMKRGSIRKTFTSTFSEKDLVTGGNNGVGNESDIDPNDDLPTRWNPASLVTAAQSKLPHGKIDRQGFYKNMKGHTDTAYGKVQTLVKGKQDEIPNDFNLQSIGKPLKKKKYEPLHRDDSIVWGDESIISSSMPDREVGSVEADRESVGIEMVDDSSYSELNEASKNYLMNGRNVEKRMWRRDRRRLGIILSVAIIFFSICLGLYLSGHRNANQSSSPPPSSTQPNDDEIIRSEPPLRPLPIKPMTPTDGFDSSGLHTINLNDLQYIVNKITPDAAILNDPHTPQSKALEWAKNDMAIYNVEVVSRVAQRYALATLYYSTNGTGWQTNANWGHGHECEWYGVGCESGENNIVSVTYLDLNSNHLDGTIPEEIGYIAMLEQIHLWGNNLVGSIPSTLSQLINLNTLYLDQNHLDGDMGDTFNSLRNLKHLDLSGNRLRGHIPHGLGSLTNLRDLRLSNNFLTSTFPASLISLSNLQTLLLDSNAISGSLPFLVGEMRSLVTIRIHENDFKGKLPHFSDAERLEEAQ